MASNKGGKNSANARQAAKNDRRRRRRKGKVPAWMRNQPMQKHGPGGTDKSGTVRPSPVRYSRANAELRRGVPHQWPGLPFRGKDE